MPRITDLQLKTRLGSALGLESAAEVNAKWNSLITESADSAWQAVFRALVARGYSAVQVDSWDDSEEFQLDIGLFFCLVRGGGLNSYDDKFINKLDRRKELETCQILIAGLPAFPGSTSTTKVVGRGRMTNTEDGEADLFSRDVKW